MCRDCSELEAAEKALEDLEVARGIRDHESPHIQAENALLTFLYAIGYDDVADRFKDVRSDPDVPWYYA